ncbi:hypothetical protein [Kitasatospora sp. GAS204B]|uniref:hypothetical protein n=1 Tax=unclassified Kitasatospora TaxID=2633591 RepID=UPI002474A11C|nr:hypothetical protein [Kitasatospora sp. GAS204B]MDH6121149.1 hypothetical protein [Kitasatospora sp. GAS204B]
MNANESHEPLIEIAAMSSDSRYRLVRFKGHLWEPVDQQEFRAEATRLFPQIDLADPEQVEWQDHPWEWPTWHPGEA